jgi:hypothetical protein
VYRFSSLELLLAWPPWETRKQKAGFFKSAKRASGEVAVARGVTLAIVARSLGFQADFSFRRGCYGLVRKGQRYAARGKSHRVLENGYCSQGNGRKKRNGGEEGGRRMGLKWDYCPRNSLLGGWVDEWMRLLRLVPVLPRTSLHCAVIPHSLRTRSTFLKFIR